MEDKPKSCMKASLGSEDKNLKELEDKILDIIEESGIVEGAFIAFLQKDHFETASNISEEDIADVLLALANEHPKIQQKIMQYTIDNFVTSVSFPIERKKMH